MIDAAIAFMDDVSTYFKYRQLCSIYLNIPPDRVPHEQVSLYEKTWRSAKESAIKNGQILDSCEKIDGLSDFLSAFASDNTENWRHVKACVIVLLMDKNKASKE